MIEWPFMSCNTLKKPDLRPVRPIPNNYHIRQVSSCYALPMHLWLVATGGQSVAVTVFQTDECRISHCLFVHVAHNTVRIHTRRTAQAKLSS